MTEEEPILENDWPIPIVYGRVRKRKGFPDDEPYFMFRCPFCHVYHHHASAPLGRSIAHCFVPTSPYRLTGYVLALRPEPGAAAAP